MPLAARELKVTAALHPQLRPRCPELTSRTVVELAATAEYSIVYLQVTHSALSAAHNTISALPAFTGRQLTVTRGDTRRHRTGIDSATHTASAASEFLSKGSQAPSSKRRVRELLRRPIRRYRRHRTTSLSA